MDKTTKTLTKGWKFYLGECDEAWYKGYDDSAWLTVMVPHDWSVEGPFSKANSSGTGYLQGGIGWYRIHFTLPEEYKGKSVRVIFDGVYKNSQVWCNSYYFGNRPFGYTEFSYDITHAVAFGDVENVIAVKVTHTDLADSRWFTGSGIYRKVQIVVEEPVHPALHGVQFAAENISRESADVKVIHEVVNTTDKEQTVSIKTALTQRVTKEVAAELTGCVTVAAGKTEKVELTGTVKNPSLWSIEEPVLYTMKSAYDTGDGAYVVNCENVGIRKISVDPDKGFFLNDVPTTIKGVCLHHDACVLGAAVTAEVWQRRLELLKEMGCNAIRCSHNPHMPELYELCDTMGFIMMDEAFDEWEGAKNKWSTGHNVYPPKHQGYFEAFPVWHEEDLRTMVRRDRNHPSVVFWSIGNEIDYPNDPYCHPMFQTMTGNNDKNKPAAEREYNPNKPNMERLAVLAKELASIVREEDNTRLVTLASAFPELSTHLGFVDELDIIGYNYKEQFYVEDHKRFPNRAFIGTENSGHPLAWQAVTDNDFVCGQFLWIGFDFLGEAHGWPIYCSQAGYLKTNGVPKDRYYTISERWGGNAVQPAEASEDAAVDVDIALWKGADILKLRSFDKASIEDGYIYQFEITLKDAEGRPTKDDHLFRVQVMGAGKLAGIDNGNVSDLTPFSADYRKTLEGKAVVYVKRTGKGDITLNLSCIEDQKSMLKGRNFTAVIDR